MNIIHLKEIDSTNIYLLNNADKFSNEEITVAVSDYQTAGRGMGTNTWESEPDKNLLFSMLIHPTWLEPYMQYIISMAHALSLSHRIDQAARTRSRSRGSLLMRQSSLTMNA